MYKEALIYSLGTHSLSEFPPIDKALETEIKTEPYKFKMKDKVNILYMPVNFLEVPSACNVLILELC